jgi:hypothetical protein
MTRFFIVFCLFLIILTPQKSRSQASSAKPVNVVIVPDSSLSVTDSLQKKITELDKRNRMLMSQLDTQKKLMDQNIQISGRNQQELIKLKSELDDCKRQAGYSQSISERQKSETAHQQELLNQQLNQARKQKAEDDKYKADCDKKIHDLQMVLDSLKMSQPGGH